MTLASSEAQQQPDQLTTLLSDLNELIAETVAHLSKGVP
jgi:hypothetical protein